MLFAIQFNVEHFSGAGFVFVMAVAIIGGLIGSFLPPTVKNTEKEVD
jgi:hypothetical protein